MDSIKLTNTQKDVLREIGNIGAGNATTAMAELVQEKMTMEVPAVHVVTVNELIDKIGGPEEEIVAILFKIKGEITGTIYLILTVDEAQWIVEQMTIDEGFAMIQEDRLQEYAASVLKEVANILAGSYLSALADFTSLHMQPTVPFISMDMAGATLGTGFVEISEMSDYAFIIDTIISGANGNGQAKGHFLLMPDLSSIPILFSALGIHHEKD